MVIDFQNLQSLVEYTDILELDILFGNSYCAVFTSQTYNGFTYQLNRNNNAWAANIPFFLDPAFQPSHSQGQLSGNITLDRFVIPLPPNLLNTTNYITSYWFSQLTSTSQYNSSLVAAVWKGNLCNPPYMGNFCKIDYNFFFPEKLNFYDGNETTSPNDIESGIQHQYNEITNSNVSDSCASALQILMCGFEFRRCSPDGNVKLCRNLCTLVQNLCPSQVLQNQIFANCQGNQFTDSWSICGVPSSSMSSLMPSTSTQPQGSSSWKLPYTRQQLAFIIGGCSAGILTIAIIIIIIVKKRNNKREYRRLSIVEE